MSNTIFDSYLKSYAQTRASEVSETPKVNFVSTDVAIDFFEQGKKIGEQEFKKKLRESISIKVSTQINATLDVVKQINNIFKEKKFIANKLFLSLNLESSKILFTVPEEQHYSEDFMNLFYTISSDLEGSYSKNSFALHILAMDESDNLNTELLKADGYSFAFDLINEKKIY